MARITRVLQKIFGSTGATSNFGVFGSRAINSPAYTKDIATIQSLAAFLEGWTGSINSANKAPFLEDLNSIHLMFSTQLAYMFQEGIVEWDAGTEYHQYSIVKKTATWELYGSLQNTNVNNALPVQVSDSYWIYLGDLRNLNQEIVIPEPPAAYVPPTSKLFVMPDHLAAFTPTADIRTKVPLKFPAWDIDSEFNPATNSATIKKAGYYQVNAQVCFRCSNSYIARVVGMVMKNSAEVICGYDAAPVGAGTWEDDGYTRVNAAMSAIVLFAVGDVISLSCNISPNYISLWTRSDSTNFHTFLSYAHLA